MNKKIIAVFSIILFSVLFFYPYKNSSPIKYAERHTNKIKTEKVPGEFWLVWLYNNPVGKLSLEYLVKRKFVSYFYGKKMDSPESADKIDDFVSRLTNKTYNMEEKTFIKKIKSLRDSLQKRI